MGRPYTTAAHTTYATYLYPVVLLHFHMSIRSTGKSPLKFNDVLLGRDCAESHTAQSGGRHFDGVFVATNEIRGLYKYRMCETRYIYIYKPTECCNVPVRTELRKFGGHHDG